MAEVVEIPGMMFRGRKVYLESQGKDEEAIEHFVAWIKHNTGHDLRDNSFYHIKARETLGITKKKSLMSLLLNKLRITPCQK